MAVLSVAIRKRIYAALMRKWSAEGEECSFLKAEGFAAVGAVDDLFDANQTAFNNALPEPFKSEASVAQKADVFNFVIRKRYGDDRLPREEV